MTATEQPSVTITGPAEMVGAVPYLLGFHPEQSLVIVGVDGTKVLVIARIDLADVTETDDSIPVLPTTNRHETY